VTLIHKLLQAKLIAAHIHAIPESLNSTVVLISHQITQQRIEFSAAGFFNIDYSLLVSVIAVHYFGKRNLSIDFQILASFLTFEIVLIQFYLDD